MKTLVAQCLIDAGDPLALELVSQGADIVRMIPVSEWEWNIYKVTYYNGLYDEDQDLEILKKNSYGHKSYYLFSTDDHVEGDAGRFSPSCDWYAWENEEEVKGRIPRRGSFEKLGYGLYKTISELKKGYGLLQH
jgi:hypothetical protein